MQYYYNATTGEFMYWDASKHTYLPAPTNAATEQGQDDDKANPEKKDKKDKVKVAKKIAKVFFTQLRSFQKSVAHILNILIQA